MVVPLGEKQRKMEYANSYQLNQKCKMKCSTAFFNESIPRGKRNDIMIKS